MSKAHKNSVLPEIVKAAIEEMSRLLVTLRTLCLASEVVKKLEKVTETLLRVKMDYPELKIDIEETKQTDAIYEPIFEPEMQTTPNSRPLRRDKNISIQEGERQRENTPFRMHPVTPPVAPKKKVVPLPPLRKPKEQQRSSSPSSSAYNESNKSSVSGGLVRVNYEDPGLPPTELRPYSKNSTTHSRNRDTMFPQDTEEGKGGTVEQSKGSVPVPPQFSHAAVVSSTKSADPPRKRDSIALFTKGTTTKAGNEKNNSFCVALWNCEADADNELSFRKGDRMRIVDRQYEDKGWLMAELKGKTGLVPVNYVN